MKKLPKEFLELCHSVTAKRAKTVIEHILKHGQITTEELKVTYGYDHPPRAARDVREHGIPIETFWVTGSNGRKIGAYRFGDMRKQRFSKLAGRTGLSKNIRESLIAKYGCKCFIYLEKMEANELQIDHRVPYEVGGDKKTGKLNPEDFMLLSSSANRAKSWSCEHCENWSGKKDKKVCLSCYWAYPESYTHIAMRQIRRVDLIWQGNEVATYDKLKAQSIKLQKEIPAFVKQIIEAELSRKKPS
ncbi:MAG: helix-turn-helix domain-containing protein [Gallionella sp.]|nr:helix-turn-helix domain-containing protein [Gallionella sp.]